MNFVLANAAVARNDRHADVQIGLSDDHRVLRDLFSRFLRLDDRHARRDVMHVAIDLFEVHCALDALSRSGDDDLSHECESVHDLMDLVEASDPRSVVHDVRAIELCEAFTDYVRREEAGEAAAFPKTLLLNDESAVLLRERAKLRDYAERLLRPH